MDLECLNCSQLSPFIKIPRNLIQTMFQPVHRTCWVLHRTNIYQCLKGKPVLPWTRCLRKQCLHASAALFILNKSKPLRMFSSQPEDARHKELKEESPLNPSRDAHKGGAAEPSSLEADPLEDKSLGLVQRFKKILKQYGKVVIPVHVLTYSIWFGSFYYAAMQGMNVVPILEALGLPENIISFLKNSETGNVLTAYTLCKIASPARYIVTLGGTSITIKYLRKYGYLSRPPPVKGYLHDRMEETKELLSGKMEETKDKITEKMEETRDKITEKMEETKGKITEKMEETKDKITEKMEETKDKITEKIQETKEKVSFKKRNE
ncbi:PREDICTED: protein FAM210A isoform X1 [Crocodylus porosus]|uniref:protein FAM210A isoform X1 n=1 Tax=Crocodylus porosus TaxID=8502 RepID=UPI00093DB69E|nr:PREDICTED: protein FAM210A isoform X1 [Crocodylus porosus]